MNMSSFLESTVHQAIEQKAQEILVNPAQPLRLRIGRELVPLASDRMSPAETRQLVSQILSDEEKKSLFEDLSVQGVRSLGEISFRFHFQIDFDGVAGSLELQPKEQMQWQWPQLTVESLARPQGLNLVVGPRRSGKTTAIQNMLQSLTGRKKVIAIYTENEALSFQGDHHVVSQFPLDQLTTSGVLRSADLVVIDGFGYDFCERALRLTEEGRSVLLTMPFWDLRMALQRFLDLSEGSPSGKARRLASVLQMAVALRLLPGIETPLVGAFELLMASAEVQTAIEKEDFTTLERQMKTTGEKTGMRCMNQAIFQLLIKRKIEMKSAFEFSPEPQELDALLKKVGI